MKETNNFSQLTKRLSSWNRRRKLRDGLIWLPRAMVTGLLLAVLLATISRFRPLLENSEVAYATFALVSAALLLGLIALLAQRANTLQQAVFADQQFELQERAATAIELRSGQLNVPPALIDLQLADTMHSIAGTNTRTGMPLRLMWRDWLVLFLATALLLGAIWLPNPQADILRHQRAVAATVAEQVATLEALAQEIAENSELSQGQKAELLEPITGALETLQDNQLNQTQAVAALSEAEADLQTLSENVATDLLNNLQAAGQPLANNANAAPLGTALQNGNLAAAGSAAAQTADALPAMSAAEQAALAQDLAETAAGLANVDSELAQQFADAAQALQNGDIAAAQQALREAGGTLQERAQQAAAAQQAANAASTLQAGREQVAQADQGSTTTEGQQGQGAGQSQGEGQNQGSVESGSSGTQQGGGTGGTGGESGHSENVFIPDFTDLDSIAGQDVELPAECFTDPESCGGLLNENPTAFGDERSSVPYEQVFGDYRNAAYEALDEDYIPLGLKGFIRDYFASLEPQ